MGLNYKEVLKLDYVSFRAMYESVERNHAADMLEMGELNLVVAAATTPGAEGAFDTLQDRLEIYRNILGYEMDDDELAEKGWDDLIRDFGRGL